MNKTTYFIQNARKPRAYLVYSPTPD